MPKPKDPNKLTKKQEDFARAYVRTGNATEAYKASYSADAMSYEATRVEASRVLARSNVSLRVKELLGPGMKQAAMDAEETILELSTVARAQPDEPIKYSDKLNALGIMAKHHALFEKDNRQKAATQVVAINITLLK